MNAQLNFDLTDFDDRLSHQRCVKSTDMASVIFEFHHNTKKNIHRIVTERAMRNIQVTPHEAVDMVFECFDSLLDEYGIMIDDLIV